MSRNIKTTIHSSRTIMFSELSKVMDFGIDDNDYLSSLDQNVFNKKTESGKGKTAKYLKTLYGFNYAQHEFRAFKYFWQIAEENEKPLLAFVYAMNHDYLLSESIDVVQNATVGDKVTTDSLEQNIARLHPNKYANNTRKSMAQNIVSSWKQAGFIEGKVKSLKVLREISYKVGCFAFLLAYLKGNRGDFIWNSIGVKALCLNESKLRELALQCAKNDLMQYQYAGDVTIIAFTNLLKKIGIDAI